MNTCRKLLLLGAALLSLAFSSNAAALSCYAAWGMELALPAVFEVNRDAVNGDVLWSRTYTPQVIGQGQCSGTSETTLRFRGSQQVAGQPAGILETLLPGIGVRYKSVYKNCPQGYWPVICTSTFSLTNPEPFQLTVELVKIGPISPMEVSSHLWAVWEEVGPVRPYYIELYPRGTISVVFKRQPTCSFPSNSTIQASLGTVSAGSFRGVGSTSPERPFKIDLSCKGGDGVTPMDAYVTLTDATNPGNRSRVLTLSPDSGARGLGVEVLSGTTVLGYGEDSNALGNPGQWKAGPVSPGTSIFSIPLAARYVQTESVVTPGSGNARATFTMSYQ